MAGYETVRASVHRAEPDACAEGINQNREVSTRSLDNTGPRRFAIIEQDSGNANEQAAVLLDLANVFALVLVVYSGKSSLHGWFCVEGENENLIDKFYDRAVRHGGDNAMRCRCQLARMPGGTRRNGVRQPIIYFDPEAIVLRPASPASAERDIAEVKNGVPKGTEADSSVPCSRLTFPGDVAVILSSAPPFGKGLLSWIRPAGMQLLQGGRSATEVARLLHLVTSAYPQLTPAEIHSLKRGPL